MSKVNVFISYARKDYESALRLHNDLKNLGVTPWLDSEDLLPGEKWETNINKVIKTCTYFIALLSSHSVSKKGFVQKEIKRALDVLDEFPDSTIYLIPARLDDCEPNNEKLQAIHRVDLFPSYEDGLKRILSVLIPDKIDSKITPLPDEFEAKVTPPPDYQYRRITGSKETDHTYFEMVKTRFLETKDAIAKRIVSDFLNEGDSIVLDGGTSLVAVANEIVSRFKLAPITTHFSIMTHNRRAFDILTDGTDLSAYLDVFLAGGLYNRNLNAFFGAHTVAAYTNYFPKVVVIGAVGISSKHGLFCHGNTEELALKQFLSAMPTRDRIIVVDFTKIGVLNGHCFCKPQNLSLNTDRCIIVSNKPDETADKSIKERFANELLSFSSYAAIETI